MQTELVLMKEEKALEAFTTKGGLDPFLNEVKTMVEGFEHDMTTKKGRDATRSFAHDIARFKQKVDGLGKDLTEEWKKKAAVVDASRKHSRDTLEALKLEARKPLTDWEEEEEKRIESHRYNLAVLKAYMVEGAQPSEAFAVNLDLAKAIRMGECWEEFAAQAAVLKDEVVEFLEEALEAAKKREADAAELLRLRQEAKERQEREKKERLEKEQLEREELVAKEAKEKAEREAKEAAELAEREAAEREKRLIIEKEEAEAETRRVERERVAEAERAKEEEERAEQRRLGSIEQAKKDEAARIQREADEATAKQERLEANKRHTNKIRKQTKDSLLALGMPDDGAEWIVKQIVDGLVKNVTINY